MTPRVTYQPRNGEGRARSPPGPSACGSFELGRPRPGAWLSRARYQHSEAPRHYHEPNGMPYFSM
jgi:hypothetical protein